MIYLDHASTSYISSEVLKEMKPFQYETHLWANYSSIHKCSKIVRSAIDLAIICLNKFIYIQNNQTSFGSRVIGRDFKSFHNNNL